MDVIETAGYGRYRITYKVSSGDFDKKLLEASSEVPVLLHFGHHDSSSQGPMLTPKLENAVRSLEQPVKLARVDVDKEGEMADRFEVEMIPTVILIMDKEIADRFAGFKKEAYVKRFLQRTMSLSAGQNMSDELQQNGWVQSEPVADLTTLKPVKDRRTRKQKKKVEKKQQEGEKKETKKTPENEKETGEEDKRKRKKKVKKQGKSLQDIEAFVACAGLIAEYWPMTGIISPKNVPELTAFVKSSTLSKFVDIFIEKIGEHRDFCSPGEADRWCGALEQEPFAPDQVDFDRLYGLFTERIKSVMTDEDESQAYRWLRFFDRRTQTSKKWGKNCFETVFPDCPASVAKGILEAVNSFSDTDEPLLSILKTVPVSDGKSTWDDPFYRAALWACKFGSEERDELIAEYLNNTFEDVKYSEELFHQWVDVVINCQKKNIMVLEDNS